MLAVHCWKIFMQILRVIFLLGAFLLPLAVRADEKPILRSVEDLPVDRFDEYPTNSFPPWPWMRVGATAPDLQIALRAEGESPFCGNKVTGKGLVLRDTSTTAGHGTGVAYGFTPPPDGDVYLGFDFSYENPQKGQGLDFMCALAGPGGKGLQLHMGEGDNLTAIDAEGKNMQLAVLTPKGWYHISALVKTDGVVSVTLTDFAKDRKKEIKLPLFKIAMPAAFSNLSFTSAAPDERTGAWMLDNVCMAGRVDAPRAAWLPFDQAPLAELRQSPRKVFAYYFIFTSGYSDEDPGLSWYTRTVLNPTILASCPWDKDREGAGTELLYRPFPRPPMTGGLDKEEVRIRGMEEEIRLARQQGLDGFLVDFWDKPKPNNGEAEFTKNSFAILDAALRVDPDFKIIPAVYSRVTKEGVNGEADEGCDPVDYANSPIIKRICEHPATKRLADGRIVFSEWLSEKHSVAWWSRVMAQMATNGHPIALLPQFNSYGKLQDFSRISYGMSHWGPRSPNGYDWIKRVRQFDGVKCVFPIVEQDVRTRGCSSFESCNSETLRHLWRCAINAPADWAFVYTWSDFTEQAMQPSTCIGFAPYDINAYYTQWFKTGIQPKIVRDTLYYFYRKHHTDVEQARGDKWKFRDEGGPRSASGTVEHNEIELLAFLATPGTLQIEAAGQSFQTNAPAGVTSFKVPLPRGVAFVPQFSLARNGRIIMKKPGHFAVLDKVEFPHMLYCSGVIRTEEP
jgi:hypothetical protein